MPLIGTRRALLGGNLSSLLQLAPTALYDSRAIAGLADGDPVGTWSDLSGNGYHATQATAAKKPLYKTGIVNGLPGVLWDGVDDLLGGTITGIPVSAVSILCVARYNSAGDRAIFDSSDGGGTNRSVMLFRETNLITFRAAGAGTASYSSADNTNFHVFAGVHKIASRAVYQDGLLRGTDSTVGSMAAAPNVFQFGALYGSLYPFSGYLALLAVWRRTLTASELRAAHRLLGATYNIAVTL